MSWAINNIHDIHVLLQDHLQVPQTPASLAQMSLAQRAEQAVLQERALEGQNEGHGGEAHTVTIVGSGTAGNGLASGGTIQVRGLGQMAAGATLQLAQLAGGQVSPIQQLHLIFIPFHILHLNIQVVHILQPVGTERGEGEITQQDPSLVHICNLYIHNLLI